MNQKEKTRKRSEMLKELRKKHQETIQRAKRLLKAFNVSKEICKIIEEDPKTVPEIAEVIGMPTHQVLWYLTAMKKYEEVVEEGMSGGYVLYKRAEEKA